MNEKDRIAFKERFYIEADKQGIEVNTEFQKALETIVTGSNVFLTGNAGKGKSTFINILRACYTGNMAVCGSTGVASANIQGVTLHSLMSLPLKAISKHSEYMEVAQKAISRNGAVLKNLDLLVIDEISMTKPYHISAVDHILKQAKECEYKPFGGCSIILTGDVAQASPIVDNKSYEPAFLKENFEGCPFFFSSPAYKLGNFKFIELKKNYRQGKNDFSDTLDRLRDYTFTQSDIDLINTRVVNEEDFYAEDDFLYLSSTNKVVNAVNKSWLDALEGRLYTFNAETSGKVLKSLIPDTLHLKEGCQIMALRNDKDKQYFNGSRGTFLKQIDNDTLLIEIEGEKIKVERYEEKSIEYKFDKESNSVIEKTIGRRLQFPITQASAISVHKSQGISLDRAFIDLSKYFKPSGLAYVALSRVRKLEGVGLARKVTAKDFPENEHLVKFLEENA
ncbi:MAG: AAA family ATPase [Candidatus Woesearchaeota archaeon]|jgi:ATP-dependent DNA helicase PIF1|nr:AAA family ATPase [Candidatus Woesearchaeota archaeon]